MDRVTEDAMYIKTFDELVPCGNKIATPLEGNTHMQNYRKITYIILNFVHYASEGTPCFERPSLVGKILCTFV